MISLILVIAILVIAYFLQSGHPYLAGLVAVIPVKIIGVALMSFESGGMLRLSVAIEGMLVGQLVWAVVLLFVYIAVRN